MFSPANAHSHDHTHFFTTTSGTDLDRAACVILDLFLLEILAVQKHRTSARAFYYLYLKR